MSSSRDRQSPSHDRKGRNDRAEVPDLDALASAVEDILERRRRGEFTSFAHLDTDDLRTRMAAQDLAEMLDLLAEVRNEPLPERDTSGAIATPAIGADRTLGDYRTICEIGRGGMGVVYDAEEMSLGRRVALKVLAFGPGSNSRRIERFRRETRAVARLEHPHIVPIYGVGSEAGLHFYAMRRIDGQGLDAVIAELRAGRRKAQSGASRESPADRPGEPFATVCLSEGRTFYSTIARIASQAASALECAHSSGILHRDIKPSNLLVEADGMTWLTDFGLAKDVSGDTFTRTGDVVGTLGYLAPEATRGWSDPRSDLYSLGLTLYELATLQPAFRDPEGGVLVERILHESPPTPRRLDPKLPMDLETIILRCIEKEPQHRYASARELREDLEAFVEGRPIRARRIGHLEHAWRWCGQNKALSTASGVVILLVLSTLVSIWIGLRLDAAEKEGRFWRITVESESLLDADRPGHREDGLALVDGAIEILGDLQLSKDEREDRRVALRELALRHELGMDVEPVAEIHGFELDQSGLVSLSPRLDQAVRIRSGSVLVHSLPELEVVRRIQPPRPHLRSVTRPEWSPRGRYLIVSYQPNTLAIFDLHDSSRRPLLFTDRKVPLSSHSVSPSERWVAFASSANPSHLRLVALESREIRTEAVMTSKVSAIALSPLDDTIAVATGNRVVFRSVETGLDEHGKPLEIGEPVNSLSWSPDGECLAVASERRCQIFDTRDGTVRVVLLMPGVNFVDTLYSPLGDLLLTRTRDGIPRLWNARTGRRNLTLGGVVTERDLTFSCDGSLLLKSARVPAWARSRNRVEAKEGRPDSVRHTNHPEKVPQRRRIQIQDGDRGPGAPSDQAKRSVNSCAAFHIVSNRDLRILLAEGGIDSITWGPAEGELLGALNGELKSWKIRHDEKGMIVATDRTIEIASGYLDRVVCDRDAGRLIVGGDHGVGICEMNPSPNQRALWQPFRFSWLVKRPVRSADIGGRGRYLVVVSEDHTIEVYDLDARELVFARKFRKLYFDLASIDSTGEWLLVSNFEHLFRFRWRDPSSRAELLKERSAEVIRLLPDPRTSQFHVLCRDRRLLLDLRDWRIRFSESRGFYDESSTSGRRHPAEGRAMTISADGRLLATIMGRSDRVLLERLPDRTTIAHLDISLSDPVDEISLSPDGRYLVARSTEQGLDVLDLATIRERLAERGLDW